MGRIPGGGVQEIVAKRLIMLVSGEGIEPSTT